MSSVVVSDADMVQHVLQSPKYWERNELPYFGYCYSVVTNTPNTYGLVMRYQHQHHLSFFALTTKSRKLLNKTYKIIHLFFMHRNGENWRKHRRVANKALLAPKVFCCSTAPHKENHCHFLFMFMLSILKTGTNR